MSTNNTQSVSSPNQQAKILWETWDTTETKTTAKNQTDRTLDGVSTTLQVGCQVGTKESVRYGVDLTAKAIEQMVIARGGPETGALVHQGLEVVKPLVIDSIQTAIQPCVTSSTGQCIEGTKNSIHGVTDSSIDSIGSIYNRFVPKNR